MRNVTYSIQKCYLGNRTAYQPVYCGKVCATPYFCRELAVAEARKIAESIRADYISRGIRARTLFIDPVNYNTELLDVTA